MNKALTINLLQNEVRTMMKRIAECDKRIASNVEAAPAIDMLESHESESQRKQRLLGLVAERMKQIAKLSE